MRHSVPIVVATVAALLIAQPLARAFHTGQTFDDAPGAGGAGGLFYAGSPRERGWTCQACHTDAPGKIQVDIASTPTDLFSTQQYTPDTAYDFTVTLHERLGLTAGISNHNGLVVVALGDTPGEDGRLGGFAPNTFHVRGDNIIATAGLEEGITTWTFSWTAPSAGSGPVTLYFGVVDGNGAETGPTENLTDPIGDDVFMTSIRVVPEP